MKHYIKLLCLVPVLIAAGCAADINRKELQTFQVSQVYPIAFKADTPSDIPDYHKFYKPRSFNYNMFDPGSKYSWHRFRQSEHFFVFWEKEFGSDPASASLPPEMRVDVEDLLKKAEQFYELNVNKLKMCTVGQGKSYLDYFKIQIYLVYQTQWLATGSGYDNVIGALWVNPSTCRPVGKTIAHEVGHTFQYQVYCDQLLNGAPDNSKTGWRYGFGPGGSGGNGFWEQSAQFQAYQLYPELALEQNFRVFSQNTHRHFNSEFMRYQNFWFMFWFTEKYGMESFSRLWKESRFPEDPLETYTRIINGNDWNKTWNDYYEYAARTLTCDFNKIRNYYNPWFSHPGTKMYSTGKKFRPAYSNCPSTSGFNIIKLKVPLKGTSVNADISALAPGTALCPQDAGNTTDPDGRITGKVTSYNSNVHDGKIQDAASYRIGFAGIKNNKAFYGPVSAGKNVKASMNITEDFDSFYIIILASPENYTRHFWNDSESDDIQWPYEIEFTNTSVEGMLNDGDISFGTYCNASKQDYIQGTLNFRSIDVIKKTAHCFNLSQEETVNAIIQPKAHISNYPQEGKIVIALTDSSGKTYYTPTATTGFWCNRNSEAAEWGPAAAVYFEYNAHDSTFTYGHLPNYTKQGETIIVHPVFIYRKNGTDYKVRINFYYIFK